MMGYGDMAGYGWIWMTVGLVFWGLIAALVVYALSRFGSGQTPSDPTPDEILRRRYARGEIDAAEYEARRRVIHG